MKENKEDKDIKKNTETASEDIDAEKTENAGNTAPEEKKSSLDSIDGEASDKAWDTLEASSLKIAELEAKLAEKEKARLMALAEMDNQRKRFANEKDNLRKIIQTDTVFPFLQVFDHFKMAVDAAANTRNFDSLQKGMEMIQAEFDRAFGELGLDKIETVGRDFDPKLHEAVAYEPSDDVPKDKIIRQWCHGFKSGDRLVKPASVVVSSGPAKKD